MHIEDIKVFGWENAIRGMRFPMDSEEQVDTYFESGKIVLGDRDKNLCLKLIKAGKDHRKFLRMIHVQFSVKMPLTWWSHYDTYKVGTVANSRSKMHKFGTKELTLLDFQRQSIPNDNMLFIQLTENTKIVITIINKYIEKYNETKKDFPEKSKIYWKAAIDLLPNSYLQERMLDLNYEVLINICKARKGHKLNQEWSFFVNTVTEELPYLKLFLNHC
jgi:hypothetical protein